MQTNTGNAYFSYSTARTSDQHGLTSGGVFQGSVRGVDERILVMVDGVEYRIHCKSSDNKSSTARKCFGGIMCFGEITGQRTDGNYCFFYSQTL
jgi:hypothetical protein